MILKHIIGYAVIKATGFDENKFINELKNACKVISLNKIGDAIYVYLYAHQLKIALSIAQKHGFAVQIEQEKGLYFTVLRHIKRYGIYVGVLISLVLMIYFSNIAMRIEIAGTDNKEIKNDILDILESEGVSPGVYIPSVNFIEVNLRLNSLCDQIAWSSIAHTGSVIKVDVAELTPKEDRQSRRIPSNIIAKRDGVIVKAEVLSGQLEVLIGDAVAKGDMLVSGVIERRNGVTYYYHSFGKILAEYTENIQINQNYKSTKKHLGKTHYTRALRLFQADFRLPAFKTSKGNYNVISDTAYLYFFGIKLPIGVTTNKYTEISFEHDVLSTEEAFLEAYRLLDNYEKNILSSEEIISRKVEELMTENGVTLNVEYKLRGEIGAQQEIFAK